MNSNESLPLQLKPLISYPREAQVGKTYLVSIDVQLATSETSWDFPEEEYTIGFILNTQPYFTCKPLHGESWPSIVLHRYGGTYGPAEYLFTAADHEIGSGHMSITLVNGWGIPMTKLQLPCTVKLESSSIQAESREITLPVPQETTKRLEIHDKPDAIPEIHDKFALIPEPEEHSIAAMLTAAGWFVVDDSDSTLDEDTVTRSATGIAVRASTYNTINHVTDLDFLLLINGKVTGQVTEEGESVFLTDLDEVFAERPTSSIFQKISLEDRRKPLPFIYEMQGEEIHFTNNLEPEARSRIVFHFHRPETFAYWLKQAPVGTPNDLNALLRSRLRRMPPVPETLPVAHIEAITKLEESLAQNHPRTLLQMADSSSMLINSIYRLLQYGAARCILYLIESYEDAIKVFREFDQVIDSDSNWKLLAPSRTELSNRQIAVKIIIKFASCIVWIASVESIYNSLSTPSIEDREKSGVDKGSIEPSISYHADLPIEFFDVIFFVECFDKLHREYRPLLDYFDAFFVGVGANIPSRVVSLFSRNLIVLYDTYVKGAHRLYEETKKASVDYAIVYSLYIRLKENVDSTIFGETAEKRADRMEILSSLNRVTERLFKTSFSEYYQLGGSSGSLHNAYIRGASQLYEETKKASDDYDAVGTLHMRLGKNISDVVYGDTRENQAERVEILSSLNSITERLFKTSFREYCQLGNPLGSLYNAYVRGARRLCEATKKGSVDHEAACLLHLRLEEYISNLVYGDTSDNSVEILSSLNSITERLFDCSFVDYCQSDSHRQVSHMLSADEIQVNFHTDIIPTAYCNQLSAQAYPLIQVAIDNSHPDSTDVSLFISAFIEDYSDPAQMSVTVAKGMRKEFQLLPVLKHNALVTLNDMRKVTLHYYIKQTMPETRTLKEGTTPLYLMAYNGALIAIRDKNKKIQNLTKYLTAWVTPNRSEIAILQREAINYSPNAFVGYQEGTAESVREQAQAIFSALKYSGLVYANSAFNWEIQPDHITQKVRLPRECLADGMCANCLDSTVLFASLLELSGIAPVLVLVPGHAFVGWHIQSKGKQYEFLETTMIGTGDFEQAQNEARQRYENALANGDFARTLFHKKGFARLIDVMQHRQAGIYPLWNKEMNI